MLIVFFRSFTFMLMCGRYSLVTSLDVVHAELPFVEPFEDLRVRYNIAPTQRAYVVTNEMPSQLQSFQWGLVPHWSKDGKSGYKMINARMEDIASKPSFRVPIRKQRCLVLADSFYEWPKKEGGKIPYRIQRTDGKLLIMAGLWDVWGQDSLHTFSILTAPPNAEMKMLHNRMPILLHDNAQQLAWLQAKDFTEVEPFLRKPEDGLLSFYKVSPLVNQVKNEGPVLHEPYVAPLDLFSML